MLRRHPLASFFGLTFGISWGVPGTMLGLAAVSGTEVDFAEYSPLSYAAAWGPAVAALLVIAAGDGRAGLAAYARRVVSLPGHWGLYLAVAAGVPALTLLAAVGTEIFGAPALTSPRGALGAFAVAALGKATLGPVEELGWRGFALPHLQRSRSGLRAALVLGFVWALWHLPALFVAGIMTGAYEGSVSLAVARLFVGVTAKSVIIAVLYNASGGSIALAFLYHWLGNLPYPWELDHGILFTQDVLDVALALVLWATLGRRWLGRVGLHTEVTKAAAQPTSS